MIEVRAICPRYGLHFFTYVVQAFATPCLQFFTSPPHTLAEQVNKLRLIFVSQKDDINATGAHAAESSGVVTRRRP